MLTVVAPLQMHVEFAAHGTVIFGANCGAHEPGVFDT